MQVMKWKMIGIFFLFIGFGAQAFTLGPEQRLSYTQGSSWCPDVCISGTSIHIVWMDFYASPDSDIYYIRSDNLGLSWNAVQPLLTGDFHTVSPRIIADGDTLYLAYSASMQDYSQIKLLRSQDGGVSWGPEIQVSNTSGESRFPNILLGQDGRLHLAWMDNSAGFAQGNYCYSSDQGNTWSAMEIFGDYGVDTESSPLIETESGALLAAVRSSRSGYPWPGWPPFCISLYRRNANGWLAHPIALSETLPTTYNNTYEQTLQTDAQGNIHATWLANDQGCNLFHRVSSDGGYTWSEPHRISDFAGSHPMPEIWNSGAKKVVSRSSSEIWCVFNSFWNVGIEANRRRGDLYLACSTDGGLTWQSPQQITFSGHAREPQIFKISDTQLGVVWCDDRDDVRPDHTNYGDEIYFRTIDFPATSYHSPRIFGAGWWLTGVSESSGGTLQIVAYITDPDGPGDITRVELAYDDQPLGVFLEPGGGDMGFDPDSGMYGLQWQIEPGTIASGLYNIEIQAEDASGNLSRWPSLEIYDSSAVAPYTSTGFIPVISPSVDPDAAPVMLAGYWDTYLSEADGGVLTITAFFNDLRENYYWPITVELAYAGMPTGIFLNDEGPEGGVGDFVADDDQYTWRTNIPPGALDSLAGTYPFTLIVTDSVDNQTEWPFLAVWE